MRNVNMYLNQWQLDKLDVIPYSLTTLINRALSDDVIILADDILKDKQQQAQAYKSYGIKKRKKYIKRVTIRIDDEKYYILFNGCKKYDIKTGEFLSAVLTKILCLVAQ